MSAKEFLEMITLTDFNVRMTDFPYQDYFNVQGHSRERGLEAAQDESSRYMIGLVERFSQNNAAKDKK